MHHFRTYLFGVLWLSGITVSANSQTLVLHGAVNDSSNHKRLHQSSVSILRPKDSVLMQFTRTGEDGQFHIRLKDTGQFLLQVSHPRYVDYSDLIQARAAGELDLGILHLTLKSKILEEILIKKTIPAIRIRGDTTIFKADSFHVKPGASVEDLLKQMPGFQVDRNGQITAQGERVQKVLVDGEEFFSDDPTIATKNLLANMVEDVELFDKKSDQAEFTGIDDGSKTKTINLKLKADKKNGYFGKVEAGSDANRYWNNSTMLNYFKGKSKLTAFGVMSNTGKTGLNWQENLNYGGADGGLQTTLTDEGDVNFNFEQGDEFSSGTYNGEGLPKSWNTGVNFSNKWDGDAKHLNGNVKYSKLDNSASIQTRTQYLLPDTVFYQNMDNQVYSSRDRKFGQAFYDVKLDSNSSIKLTVAGHFGEITNQNRFITESISEDSIQINQSQRLTASEGDNEAFFANLVYRKKFKKPGHTISAQFRQNYTQDNATGLLKALNSYFDPNGILIQKDTIDQQKLNYKKSNVYNGAVSYTRPISKRSYLEFNYEMNYGLNHSNRRALEKLSPTDDKYQEEVEQLTNLFDYTQSGIAGGMNYRYNKPKKLSFSIGASVSRSKLLQEDLKRDTSLRLRFTNFFPRANLNWTLPKNRTVRFSYNGSTQQPGIAQLQPVIDNTDPLNIAIGNPDLDLAVHHRLQLIFSRYDFLKERGYWNSINSTFTQRGFSTRDFVDSLGRRVFQTVNVNGVYSVNGFANYWFKLFKKFYGGFQPEFNYNQFVNFVNGVENQTKNGRIGFSTFISYNKEKKFNIWMNYRFGMNFSNSSINRALRTKYWIQSVNSEYTIFLPWKFEYGGEITARFRQKTEVFTNNNNAILVNQFLERRFMKSDQIRLKLYVYDLFNQNIGFQRNISTNLITERTYNTVNRYVLLSVIWNFSKNAKPKEF